MGVIGFGRIGPSLTGTMALGLGMNVLPYDPFVAKPRSKSIFFHTDDTFSIEYHTVALDDVIAKSDFLTLHVPASPDGKPIIGAAELACMKKVW